MKKKDEIISTLESSAEVQEAVISCCECYDEVYGYWEGMAADEAYKKGWRINEDGDPICKNCLLKQKAKKSKKKKHGNQKSKIQAK